MKKIIKLYEKQLGFAGLLFLLLGISLGILIRFAVSKYTSYFIIYICVVFIFFLAFKLDKRDKEIKELKKKYLK